MKILKKVMDKENIIGYVLDDDGFETVLLSRCLYLELYIEPLIAAGYKYFGYDANDIEDAQGNKISELPSVDASVISEDDMFVLEDMAQSALSDAECAKYYQYKNNQVVSFREPESVEIETREGLIAYLNEVEASYQRSGYCTDNVPLNSFVTKDALFSLDEIKRDPEIQRLYSICQKRHIFKDINAYKRTVKFLCDAGVLQNSDPAYIEFLVAYNAWGVDGIKDDCIKVTTRQAVDGYFDRYSESVETGNYISNRRDEFVLWDAKCQAHYLRDTVDLSNVSKCDREIIALSPDRLFEMKRSDGNWGSRFRVIRAMVSNVSDRCYYEFLSTEGYPYQVRITHDRLVIFSGVYSVDTMRNFAIKSISSDISLTLDECHNEEDYYCWNLAISKGIDICKSRSKDVPVEDTFTMLMEEGISPNAAIRMMAHDIKYGAYDTNAMYVNSLGARADYFRAFEHYTRPIPAKILDHFSVQDDYEDADDFLAQAIDPEAVVDEESTRKLSAGEKVLNALVNKGRQEEETPRDYYDNIEFVRACLNGEVTINLFGDGKREDVGATAYQAAKIILTAMWALGKETESEKRSFIAMFEDSDSIKINTVFRYRDAAYRGYIVDMSACRENRAKKSWAWCYCTKVFREMSNKDISEQRPYLMELVTVVDTSIRGAITKAVEDSINPEYPDIVRNVIMMQAGYIGARLFFAIVGGQITDKMLNGTNYEVTLNVYDDNTVTVKIPTTLYVQIRNYNIKQNTYYITLYDYCKYEYGDNGAFSMFLINADVDPWHIKPKKGYSIPTYNFMVNYNTEDVLRKAVGDNYCTAIAALKAKPVFAIGRIDPDQFLPGGLDRLYADDTVYDAETIDIFLDENIDESVRNYKDRWTLKRRDAIKNGLKIVQIPLKQDIVYNQIAKYYGMADVDTTVVYSEDQSMQDTKYLYTAQKDVLSYVSNKVQTAIAAATVTKRKFDVNEFSFEDIYSWSDILHGSFIPTYTCYMHFGALSIIEPGGESSVLQFSKMNRDDLDKLADSGILLKLGENKYYVTAYNGDFILEV